MEQVSVKDDDFTVKGRTILEHVLRKLKIISNSLIIIFLFHIIFTTAN